ncbi:MAG: PIN domain-containing protein [Candidatus Binatia bacterium]
MPRENHARLTEFLAAPFVSVLPSTSDVARVYGRVFAQLGQAGTPIGPNDIWIAACAIDRGAQVITFDADFERITGLDLLLLRP